MAQVIAFTQFFHKCEQCLLKSDCVCTLGLRKIPQDGLLTTLNNCWPATVYASLFWLLIASHKFSEMEICSETSFDLINSKLPI